MIKVHGSVNWCLWALENQEALQPRARFCYTEALDNLPARVAQQATLSTNIHFEGITWNHQSLQQKHAGPITYQTIPFHLSKT